VLLVYHRVIFPGTLVQIIVHERKVTNVLNNQNGLYFTVVSIESKSIGLENAGSLT
jgi:hypothetical protein